MQLGGFLMRYTDSWTSVFYVFGLFGLFWLVFWFVLIYNHPKRHPFISNKEKLYLKRSINTVDSEDVSIITNNISTLLCTIYIVLRYLLVLCITYFMSVNFLGQIVDSLETNVIIRTSLGIDYRSNRSRLGFVHHNYRFAQVHEISVTLFSSTGTHIIILGFRKYS